MLSFQKGPLLLQTVKQRQLPSSFRNGILNQYLDCPEDIVNGAK